MNSLERKEPRCLYFNAKVSTRLIDQSIKLTDQTGHRCLVYRLIVFLLGMLGVERRFERSGPQVENSGFIDFLANIV